MSLSLLACVALVSGAADIEPPAAAAPVPPAEAPASPAREPRVFVLRFDALAVPAEHADLVQGLVVQELATLGGIHVTSYRDVQSMMTREQLRQLLDCSESNCAAEAAQALDSDELIAGTLARFGDEHVLSLTRLDGRTARVLERRSARFGELRSRGTVRVVRELGAVLFQRPPPAESREYDVEEPNPSPKKPRKGARSNDSGSTSPTAVPSPLLVVIPALASGLLCGSSLPFVLVSLLGTVFLGSAVQGLARDSSLVGVAWLSAGCAGGGFVAAVASLTFSGILAVLAGASVALRDVRSRALPGTIYLASAWMLVLGVLSFALAPVAVLYANRGGGLLPTDAGTAGVNCVVTAPCCGCSLAACGVAGAGAVAGVVADVTRSSPGDDALEAH